MLSDVKGNTTVETSLTPTAGAQGEEQAWGAASTSASASTSAAKSLRLSGTSFGGDLIGEAEQRLLRCTSRGPGSYTRFMTLHRRRRRKPPTRQMEKHHRALLDDLYNGPTQCVLTHVGVWGFNAFALDSVCGGRPVSVLCVYLLHQYRLIQHFNLDTVTVWKCFSLIEDGYHASNPYHNAVHAADVTQAMHCYLQEEKIREHMTPLEMLAALLAAVCHDLDHPGVNQPFLIATDNHLAALYKNLSVLENHHWRCAMGCLWESGLLDSWDPKDITALQEMIRSLILATDITRQQEFLSKFRRYLETGTFDMQNPDHRHFSLQIALKCADICNPCRPWEVSRKWSNKICDEFYRQGDYERKLNLPVTSLCDRYVTSVAKIQTGFIKFVVSPLFDAWDQWLSTSLSTSMVVNMNKNLALWENELSKEVAEETTTEVSIAPPDSPPPLEGVEDAEEEVEEEVDRGTTPSSSGDSHQSVLGSLENVSRSLQLGRRHSVPLNMPRLVPRTIIRRESLPEHGEQSLVVETVMMGGLSLTSLSSHTTEPSGALTADALHPEPTITAMGGMGNGQTRHLPRLTRRMSLPPLWPQQSRIRPSHTAHPMSPTPSTTESEPRTASHGGSTQAGGDNSGDCGSSRGCAGNNNGGECGDSVEQTNRMMRGDSVSSARDCGVHSRKSLSSFQGATFLHSECSDSLHCKTLGSQTLVRRASLDSTSISSKREFLDRLAHESSKFARMDCSGSEVDKENLAPRDSSISRERQVPLWKTRAWRSLNCDDDKAGDPREKVLKPGIYKLNQSQGNIYAQGRRGSAPVLRPEDLWGGLRGGAERPDHRYLTRRRGSAPAQPIHQGWDSESGHDCGSSPRLPLSSTENLPPSDIFPTHARLRGRRGSMPFDLPGFDIGLEAGWMKDLSEKRLGRRGSGGVEALVSRGTPSLTQPLAPAALVSPWSGVSGCGGSAEGGPGPSHYLHHDLQRGSGGLELLSGLWRSHLEGGSCASDDPELCSQSSGVMTPSTPGALHHPRVALPHTLHRRGSLPTDFFYSGDLSVWDGEGT